jgi:rhamnose transport system permease protein
VSVGSIFAVCGVVIGASARAGIPVEALPFEAILMGCLLGAVNGALTSFLSAPSIVVTLATMVIWRQTLNWATGGAWVQGLPANFQWFGLGQTMGESLLLVCVLAVLIALWWASTNVSVFRQIYATGSNTEAARLYGIRTKLVTLWVFVLLGALTGLASALSSARFTDIPANAGVGLELQAIAAVVVGGTPITGGRGRISGTLTGTILLGSIGNALTYLGLSAYWERAIQGGIIVIAVLVDALFSRPVRKRLAVS